MEHQLLEESDRPGIFESPQLFNRVRPGRWCEEEVQIGKGLGRRLERVKRGFVPRLLLPGELSVNGLNQRHGGMEMSIDPTPDQVT